MNERLPSRHVVLLGIGHTNAHILRMYGMQGLDDTGLTCISNFNMATYSGMMPAVLAGQVPPEQMQIDLVKLCSSAGARLVTETVTGLDPESQQILFKHRPPMRYDLLSIGIGSTAVRDDVELKYEHVVEIKPMQSFLHRLQKSLENLQRTVCNRTLRVAIAGSGAAGVEIAFCLPAFLEQHWKGRFALSIVTRSPEILSDANTATRRLAMDALQRRQITAFTHAKIKSVQPHALNTEHGEEIPADLVIWSTGAAAPQLLSQLQLETDDRGFLLTLPTLQTITNPRVFAVGDSGTIQRTPTPKAGVYAVRQGPVLWENLQRLLADAPPLEYKPQRSFLQLLNTGDGCAIGQWKGISKSGQWLMRLKHSIDTKFMQMFEPIAMAEDEPMQCRGCGCKVGAGLLSSALPAAGDIRFDDAALVGETENHKIVASTDFFTSPFMDPYLAGRVAALHAASDIVASGALPKHALSNVVVPEGPPSPQEATLSELLAGAKREFDAMGASIVGGHTIEGPRLEIGFTVIGNAVSKQLLEKQNLQQGDGLYMTKPLGIGVLLAAHMRGRCSAEHYSQLVQAMLERQHEYAALAINSGATAGTDITGFGLAGHLIEMLEASETAATVNLGRIPHLPGAADAIAAGIQSSLAPSNRLAVAKIDASSAVRQAPAFELLFDPQTCGGLLLGMSDASAEQLNSAIDHAQLRPLVKIGSVTAMDSGSRLLNVE